MYENLLSWRVLPAAMLVVVILSGCVAVSPVEAAVQSAPDGTDVAAQSSEATPPEPATSATMESDIASVLHMREEEKLAHDVYVALHDKWGMNVFDNIAAAESQHMSMVLQALEARDIADPAAGNGPGEFTSPELQTLYDALVAQGNESAVAALTVGATIEDLDIFDLQSALATTTDSELRWLFENLQRGSENHMRAFVRNLDRYGETYEVQYITTDYFATIVEGSNGAGGPRGRGGQGNFSAGRGGRWQR